METGGGVRVRWIKLVVKLIAAGLPSPTGPLLPRVAVGGTLFTTTSVVYSVNPPSLSMIRPLTVRVPLSSNVQVVDALVPLPA